MAEQAETAEQVLEEIKKLGDNHKANYETLRGNYEELKKLVDENSKDAIAKEKIEKLVSDISVRQEELDKKSKQTETTFNERMDAIEVAMKRVPLAGGESQD